MEAQTEPPQALTVGAHLPDPTESSEFTALGESDRTAFLKRCDAAMRILAPIFAPRHLSLSYLGPYAAHLMLINADGSPGVDIGAIQLQEPSA